MIGRDEYLMNQLVDGEAAGFFHRDAETERERKKEKEKGERGRGSKRSKERDQKYGTERKNPNHQFAERKKK